jgi:hypothetical protein
MMEDVKTVEVLQKFPQFRHLPDCTCATKIEHPSHARPGVHPLDDRLYVVTVLENPLRWRSRYWNYNAFEAMCRKSSCVLYTTEVAFGQRHFEITNPANPQHLQLRTGYELWHKENAFNLTINRLPPEAQYIAWLDADIEFVRPDWAQETLQLLQHYKFLQMFSFAQDLGPEYEPLNNPTPSYIYDYYENQAEPHDPAFASHLRHQNRPKPKAVYSPGATSPGVGLWVHPGFAWAARKTALNEIGGLIDFAILGSGDWHLGTCLMEEAKRSLYEGYSEAYKRRVLEVEWRCKKYIRRNVGFMKGTVHHWFHGSKKNRDYDQRWRFLALSQYNPDKDIKPDHQGLYQLEDDGTERSIILREGIRKYARSRQEDTGFWS